MAQEHLSRTELATMVHRIRNAEGSEEEIDALVDRLERAVDHPTPTNIIFWDKRFTKATDDEIVEELLTYKPICL